MSKATNFKSDPDDLFIRWTYENGEITLNQRYYLTAMPKQKAKKLDAQMEKLNAKMEVFQK